MKRTSQFMPHDVARKMRADGSVLLHSNTPMGPVARCTGDWLHKWARDTPDQVFVAERSGEGWRRESYGATLQQVQAIAAALLGRGMGAETPIMILSGNGVDHALLSLAAQYVGIPTAPVAEQYSLVPAAHDRLRQAMQMVRPSMVYVIDATQYDAALRLEMFEGVEIVAARPGSVQTTPFETLLAGDTGDVATAHARVTPDTVAKILMTSGSTSAPKGVLTTHKMMCTNQAQLAVALPFLSRRPPRIVDWLPWNHVFGGSHNFNMMLANGGSLYIDDGKPAPGLIDRTVENLGLISGTASFNVPVGFQLLLSALQEDHALRQHYFEDLDMVFYAGATLPQHVWEGYEAMALDVKGEVPLITSSWGLTETAPGALLQQEPIDTSGVVGVPLPELSVKLLPVDDTRFEVRIKGPSIMPGYFNDPAKTAEAFDEEGYFLTGDVMHFVEPNDPNKGLKFDGRLSEEFKLLNGTWVRAGQLRLELLACLAPLAADLVITGADRSQIGLMIFPNINGLARAGFSDTAIEGALCDAALMKEIKARLATHASTAGSASKVARAIVLAEPASMPKGEMTAKGNLNFRAILSRRADMLERLYDDSDAAVVVI